MRTGSLPPGVTEPGVESRDMRLHYLPGTAAMAPHATLAEIGARYELVLVERDAERRVSDEYLALNPWGKIPTLEDGDLVLTESAAICLYLAEKLPEARLAPAAGTPERAELYRWLFWLSNTVQMTQMRHFYPERYGTAGVKEAADAELADLLRPDRPAPRQPRVARRRRAHGRRPLPLHADAVGAIPRSAGVGAAEPASALAASARAQRGAADDRRAGSRAPRLRPATIAIAPGRADPLPRSVDCSSPAKEGDRVLTTPSRVGIMVDFNRPN